MALNNLQHVNTINRHPKLFVKYFNNSNIGNISLNMLRDQLLDRVISHYNDL